MLRKFALMLAAAGGLGLAVLVTTPAGSVPIGPGLAPTVQSAVEQAQYRRCHVRRNSRWAWCRYRGPYGPYPYPYWGPYWGPPAPWPFFPFLP